MVEAMKTKFDKYWGKLGKMNLLILVALVLDPQFKLVYVKWSFEQNYDVVVAMEMEKKVKDCLIRLYNWYDARDSSNNVQNTNTNESRSINDADMEEHDARAFLVSQFQKHLKEEDSMLSKSELERYLMDGCEADRGKFDILGWWKHNSTKYRILSQVTRDVLVVPVSTVASESAFSTGGRVLDPFRSSLSHKTVEALICAQN
ncbi:hypothetical protein L1049_016672 [Liquidambar formosana]|uniref:Transposase n=1 Tax=Liquidambar formosana TaxID=63359 RepID=A0AAP0S1S9_LIQFO